MKKKYEGITREWVSRVDALYEKVYLPANFIDMMIDPASLKNYPKFICTMGRYVAAVYHKDNNFAYVNGPYVNSTVIDCWRKGVCPRADHDDKSFTSCPAVHAAGHLHVEDLDTRKIVWVEAGGSIIDGEVKPYKLGWVDGVYKTYPCIRCLSHVRNLGIETLVWLDLDTLQTTTHNIEAHMEFLVAEGHREKTN